MGLKLNPFTGKFDLVSIGPENFSYNYIATGKSVLIPDNQQMLVYINITVDGTLTVDGDLVVLDQKQSERVLETSETETINAELYEVIKQTASGITTSLSGVIKGSKVSIVNSSSGSNTLNITVQGEASPTIYSRESFSLVYNGSDFDIV